MRNPSRNSLLITNLTNWQTIHDLSTGLQAIQPPSLSKSETTQVITYTLLATAIVGIFVYHYIKNQEAQ